MIAKTPYDQLCNSTTYNSVENRPIKIKNFLTLSKNNIQIVGKSNKNKENKPRDYSNIIMKKPDSLKVHDAFSDQTNLQFFQTMHKESPSEKLSFAFSDYKTQTTAKLK